MALVNVDVDLEEFETYELVEELVSRINKGGRKKLSEKQKEQLRNELKDLNKELGIDEFEIAIRSLDDKMKMEHLSAVWNKYSSYELENRLPVC